MENDENFGPIFTHGIRIPRNVTLPEEFIQAYAYMSLVELKVTLAAIIQFMRIGGAEPITLSEFMVLTGLGSKASIQTGIDAAMRRGILTRYEVQGYRGHPSFVYEIQTLIEDENLIGTKSVPIKPLVKLSVDVKDIDEVKTRINLTTQTETAKQELRTALRRLGVFPNTANSLIAKIPLAEIEALIQIFPEAQQYGLADGVGWLVRAIQNRWDTKEIREEINARKFVSTTQPASMSELPPEIQSGLKRLGWIGSSEEITAAFSVDPIRVSLWLEYVNNHQAEYKNPAGIFRNGIRAGDYPPESGRERDRRLYGWAFCTDYDDDSDLSEVDLYEAWLHNQEAIPGEIINLWQKVYQQFLDDENLLFFKSIGQNLLPCEYEAENETLVVAAENQTICTWLMSNMKYRFDTVFQSQFRQKTSILFRVNPYFEKGM